MNELLPLLPLGRRTRRTCEIVKVLIVNTGPRPSYLDVRRNRRSTVVCQGLFALRRARAFRCRRGVHEEDRESRRSALLAHIQVPMGVWNRSEAWLVGERRAYGAARL